MINLIKSNGFFGANKKLPIFFFITLENQQWHLWVAFNSYWSFYGGNGNLYVLLISIETSKQVRWSLYPLSVYLAIDDIYGLDSCSQNTSLQNLSHKFCDVSKRFFQKTSVFKWQSNQNQKKAQVSECPKLLCRNIASWYNPLECFFRATLDI